MQVISELRSVKRRHLILYLPVVNAETDSHIGRIYDLSSKGCMLMCPEAVAVGETIGFKISSPYDAKQSDFITVKAECRYCKKDINPDFYIAGFLFHNVNHATKQAIMNLINQYAFEN